MSKIIINEDSTIEGLTNGKFKTITNSSTGIKYSGNLISAVVDLISKTMTDVSDTNIKTSGIAFKNIILNYQKKFGLKETGVLDDNLLHDIYRRAQETSSDTIEDDEENDEEYSRDSNLNPHYDPFFLNESGKIERKNNKDIIISFGGGTNRKIIKNVFMRSVSVQVDTSGNPISEVYNFIARDIKETDASEDLNKYVGEESDLNASSDIKYDFDNLFKEK
jgi:hypothetical protein